MALATYGDLQASVIARAFRSDLATLVPDFIRRAHDELVDRVVLATDITISGETTALPTDFRKAVSVWLKTSPMTPLTLANESQMTSGSGMPVYYRVESSSLIVTPIPTDSYAGSLHYKIARTFFASDSATNTVLTRHPFLYVHATMAELYRHTRNAEEAARYEGLFEAELQRVNTAEMADLLDGQLQMTSAGAHP